MFWRIVVVDPADAGENGSGTDRVARAPRAPGLKNGARGEDPAAGRCDGMAGVDGRFVLHRHCDAQGPHLDLRLEQDGHLVGWRIDAAALSGAPWATAKAPHPLQWLDQDGDAVREDAGVYQWLEYSAGGGVLLLAGNAGTKRLHVSREQGLPARYVRSICEALAECGAGTDQAGRLILDGMAARRRAVARLCGLGRELDGDAFDEAVCRRALSGLSLDEVHGQLRAYEVRFDRKYPPRAVSRAERLPEEGGGEGSAQVRAAQAFSIVRE